ncbi:MAG: putative lipid II flippase FtsW [Anaerolineales bacterium]
MGLGVGMKATSRNNPGSKKRLVQLGVDVPLLLILITLLTFGILMVYSASWDFSLAIYDSATFIFERQLVWVGLGILVATGAAFFDYRRWKRLAVPAMLITVLGLAAVLMVNEIRLNAARSLSEGSYQPSELAKIVMIIYLAVWLDSKREHLHDVSFGLLPLAGILGFVGGLIFLQPDLSAVLTIIALGGLLFFLAGGDLKQIVVLMVVALVVGWLVVAVSQTGQARIASYLEGVRDPTEASYHVRRSLEAFVKGGWFGVGIGKADTKLTGLPVPPTDSIYAVIGEETGVVGAVGVVLLYGALLWRGLRIALRAPDLLGALLAGGLSLWIVMEAFINMAVMVGLAPFAGNALPLVSAGGSNMLVTMLAMGILLNVSRIASETEEEAPGHASPVLDFRRRTTAYYAKTVPTPTLQPNPTPEKPVRKKPMASRPGLFRPRKTGGLANRAIPDK